MIDYFLDYIFVFHFFQEFVRYFFRDNLNYSVYHFDFYRFFDQNEWEESGFRDYFEENAICLVEWPEKAGGLLPQADIEIHLSYHQHANPETTGRHIEVRALSPDGQYLVKQLNEQQ